MMKYGRLAASTRQRLLQYEQHLFEQGISIETLPLFRDSHVERLAEGRSASPLDTANVYSRRIFQLISRRDFDVLWIHCELFPYLPSLFERLACLSGKPIVYDYDDAIFDNYERHPVVRAVLGGKLAPLLTRASACLCGNAFLLDYAARYCDNSIILPTVVDTDIYRPRELGVDSAGPPVIGWIGSPSTWRHVRPFLPFFSELVSDGRARVRIIGAGPQAEEDSFPGLELVKWNEATEVAEVQAMDIGIMPLADEPWTRGKCGYKLIQYMACGLPVIASPVGVNSDIVTDGVSGFLARTDEEWQSALLQLLREPLLRSRMGEAGRSRIVADYSLATHAPRLSALLKSL
jgi:glycosyltransferase involved in cell wall biosynthesis